MPATGGGFLPFSTEQFFAVMERYNTLFWPIQIGLFVLALAAIGAAVYRSRYSNAFIGGVLAFLWLWMGTAYHLAMFSTINKAAYGFGVLFLVQGGLFAGYGAFGKRISIHYSNGLHGTLGALLILYALVVYPLLGFYFDHTYPRSPTFGLPCPTPIFTFGVLFWAEQRLPRAVLVIPLLWALIGSTAAVLLGVREDLGLLVAGLLSLLLWFPKRASA